MILKTINFIEQIKLLIENMTDRTEIDAISISNIRIYFFFDFEVYTII